MGVVAAVPFAVDGGGATDAMIRANSSFSSAVSSEPDGMSRIGKLLGSSC
jgi:hypothetical protein